jgi:serine-type D-Ala-D-Ala carboxypeptidase
MSGVAPAIALGVSTDSQPARYWFYGTHVHNSEGLATSADTVFDLASLTKPLTTTLWCLRLVQNGLLNLDQPIDTWLDMQSPLLRGCPLWRLLNHTSGLPAHRPYFSGLGPATQRNGLHQNAKSSVRRMLRATVPLKPPGETEIYSDLGYLALEEICEKASNPLEMAWETLPGHGCGRLHFQPVGLSSPTPLYAATELCPWRQQTVQGEVHDDNCWTIGGVGGHAGLFGRIADVHWMGEQWLAAMKSEEHSLGIGPEVMSRVTDARLIHANGTRLLGWDTPSPGISSAGQYFSRRSIGHLGFTGTSLWIDPDESVVVTLLTNRVCPSRDDIRIRSLRPEVHDLVRQWIAGDLY